MVDPKQQSVGAGEATYLELIRIFIVVAAKFPCQGGRGLVCAVGLPEEVRMTLP